MKYLFLLVVIYAWYIPAIYGQSNSVGDSLLSSLHEIHLIPETPDSSLKQHVNGRVYSAIINNGDTIILAHIEGLRITSPRKFTSTADYLKYMKYKRYAALVYPYAKEAIRIFREAEYVSQHMKKRKRRRYLKKLSKELEREFEDPLGNLSKTQGKILIKMIERELQTPMFDLIKNTRGKMKAFYWNQFSKLYGYRLKSGYEPGQNRILDIVLQDFDVSYSITEK